MQHCRFSTLSSDFPTQVQLQELLERGRGGGEGRQECMCACEHIISGIYL